MERHMERDTRFSQSPDKQSEIRLGDGLIFLNLFSVILIVTIIFLPSGALRMILAVPYLVFVPGYTLLAAIFVKEKEINGVERSVLSVGLSFVIVVLAGLFLNYTAWGIRLEPALYFITGFVFLVSVIAWLRRDRLGGSKRYNVALNLEWLNWKKSDGGRALSVLLAAGIIGSFGYLGYLAATPGAGEAFSEFYILGESGKTMDYPQELRVGEDSLVYLGIVNHENKDISYSIRVFTGDNEIASSGPVLLTDGQKWEGEVSFTITSPGEEKKLEFMLYKDGEDTAYKNLHLWIDVTE